MTEVDPNIYAMARNYLEWARIHPPTSGAGRPIPMEANVYLGSNSRYGVALRWTGGVDWIATRPGGQNLMMLGVPPNYPAIVIVDLDFTHGDVPDEIIRRLRAPIVAALTDTGTAFLPVSGRAVANLGNNFPSLELIERQGLSCVFRMGEVPYISGFDANEDPPLYFLARLPQMVSSYAEGIEALKPPSVKLAEAQGLRVRRQGDMFAIPTTWRSHDLRAMGAVFSTTVTVSRKIVPSRDVFTRMRASMMAMSNVADRIVWGEESPPLPQPVPPPPPPPDPRIDADGLITVEHTHRRGLYGTAHTATELAYLHDGTMFARGTIEHDPAHVLMDGRNPDHKPLPLPGKTWWLVARNTVPIQERR